jgi:hypothetical protein
MNSDSTAANGEKQLAPWLPIPSRAISVVEHPAIVKNIDKGITSLGGPVKLSKVGRNDEVPTASKITNGPGSAIKTGNYHQRRG